MLSSYCEKFYIAMDNVKDSCAAIFKSECSEAEKQLSRNIARLHRASFHKLNVCGMFYIDATYPLKMTALLTNYTVVLLQFAFL
ncbi:unnamed protein product [Spodoptera exigua]|nr:unnamed protein product [Spodoptera exigua]